MTPDGVLPVLKLSKNFETQAKILANVSHYFETYARVIDLLRPALEQYARINQHLVIMQSIAESQQNMMRKIVAQNDFSKIINSVELINPQWQEMVMSLAQTKIGYDAIRIAVAAHYTNSIKAGLLAQETLSNIPWSQIRGWSFFTELSNSYSSLISSIGTPPETIIQLPVTASRDSSFEMITSARVIREYYRTPEDDAGGYETDQESEIVLEIEESIEPLLGSVNPKLISVWHGARQALNSDNPDRSRHVTISLREIITQVLHALAPDAEIRKWTTDVSHFHNDRPTRSARILYICRDINHDPFRKFLKWDLKANIEFIDLFQKGAHKIELPFTENQLKALVLRTESFVRYLLLTHKYSI